jgi:hypothetical protein
MATGFTVDPEQIRQHAENIAKLSDRFDAVKSASANIAQNDNAYGLMCGWISAILEGRHTRQDQLVADMVENLVVVVSELRRTATNYENIDGEADKNMNSFLTVLGR